MIYRWVENGTEKDVLINSHHSKRTYQQIKNIIQDFLNYKYLGKEKLSCVDVTV